MLLLNNKHILTIFLQMVRMHLSDFASRFQDLDHQQKYDNALKQTDKMISLRIKTNNQLM